MQSIKIGNKGQDVKDIQQKLGLVADGIFGKVTEAAVKKFQKEHGLVVDGIVGPRTRELLMKGVTLTSVDPSVEYNPINVHITPCASRTPKYLVIHYTAGASSKPGAAKATRNVWLNVQSSADFIVDDVTIMQVNPDIEHNYCWAVGDGKGKYGITNANSISIEICSNLMKGTSAKVPNHEGWYFTDASIKNAIQLSKILMKKYNIPIECVVRHYDASGKLCPGIVGWNDGKLYNTDGKSTSKRNSFNVWLDFKSKLA